MQKRVKRLIPALLAVLMLFGCLYPAASAAVGDSVTYEWSTAYQNGNAANGDYKMDGFNRLRDDHIDFSALALLYHSIKFITLFYACTAYPLISEYLNQCPLGLRVYSFRRIGHPTPS